MADGVEEQLRACRENLRLQMQRALKCRTNPQRKKLAAEWKRTYSERFYIELIRCARNTEVCGEIANWNLDDFRK